MKTRSEAGSNASKDGVSMRKDNLATEVSDSEGLTFFPKAGIQCMISDFVGNMIFILTTSTMA